MYLLILVTGFVFVALAARAIGHFITRIGLPYITGYLLAGALAGPFVLGLLPANASAELRFIDEVSLAVIAFVAGSELYLRELQPRLRRITLTTAGLLIVALPVGGVALYLLTGVIPFTQDMGPAPRVAVAILGSTILLALSPASTIAVIQEVRAKGSFTASLLGITVSMDVVIIVLFAVSVALAGALLTGMGFDAAFLGLLAIDLGAALGAGYGAGRALQALLGTSWPRPVKTALLLATGFLLFFSAYELIDLSHAFLPFEIHVEPLLAAMVAGFYVTNYTDFRREFATILHDISPAVYVAFFTLTGLSLKLDILLATLPAAAALFIVRLAGIYAGSRAGGALAGVPGRQGRLTWMGLVTQAGIALGLAREVAVEFPALGDAFATLIIAVVVLNEILGPMFLKTALKRAGEASLAGGMAPDEVRNVLILGIEEQSLELARYLQTRQWQVVMADTDRRHVERLAAEDVDERHVTDISEASLGPLLGAGTDAVVTLLEDDEANLRALELAYRKFGVPRLVVRPQDISLAGRFKGFDALIVDQTSAMVNLLEQAVRAPQTAALLMHQDSGREIVQITISNPDVDGLLVRNLRLPNDILFLEVNRNGQSLTPNGYTRLHLRDEVTLLGQPQSLEAVTLRLGY